jgi:hypothetical protein
MAGQRRSQFMSPAGLIELEGVPALHNFTLFLSKFFALVCSVLFVITATLVLVFYGPYRQITNPSLNKKIFASLDIYQEIPEFASQFLPPDVTIRPCDGALESCDNTLIGDNAQTIVINLAPENWQTLLEIFLPAEEMKALTETVLDQSFMFIHGDINQISIPIEMVKSDFAIAVEEGGLHKFLNFLPLCSEAEIAQVIISDLPKINIPLCKPPETILNLLDPILLIQANSYITSLPDGMNISLPASTLAGIRLVMTLLAWLPVLPLPFLLVAIWLGARSIKGRFRLAGILVFISGLLSLGVGLISRFGSKTILDMLPGIPNLTDWPPELANFIRHFGEYLLQHLAIWIIYPALILLLIGLLVWIGLILMPQKIKTPPAPSPDIRVEES